MEEDQEGMVTGAEVDEGAKGKVSLGSVGREKEKEKRRKAAYVGHGQFCAVKARGTACDRTRTNKAKQDPQEGELRILSRVGPSRGPGCFCDRSTRSRRLGFESVGLSSSPPASV